MNRPARRATVLVAATACLAAAALPALAEPSVSGSPSSSTVSLSVGGGGTRQLQLLDLAGNPLTDLSLRPGAPAPFRVRVVDTGVGALTDPKTAFSVSATLNNLYADGAPSGAFIPSGDVRVSFPASGAVDAVGSLTAVPRVVLYGTLGGCTDPTGLLGVVTDLLQATRLCTALNDGVVLDGLEVLSSTTTALNSVADVPFALAGQTGGAFTAADFVNGIGRTDTRGTGTGTAVPLLSGTPSLTSLVDELNALEAQVAALPVLSSTGVGSKVSVSAVVGSLLTSPDAELATLGSALSALLPSQVQTLLSIVTGVVQDIGLGDITSTTGSYSAVPVLTATPTTAPAAGGTYSGTMTVTLVQP